jgi:hypothetical protein
MRFVAIYQEKPLLASSCAVLSVCIKMSNPVHSQVGVTQPVGEIDVDIL